MEAANRGAQEAGGLSVGFNIDLPHEQHHNPYVDIGLTFKHFYARKTMLVKAAEGFVMFPWRVRHARRALRGADADPDRQGAQLPVVLFGRDHWEGLLGVDPGTPARDRHDLAGRRGASYLTDDPEEAVSIVVRCYEERSEETAAEPCGVDAQ